MDEKSKAINLDRKNKSADRRKSIDERYRNCTHPYFIYGQVCHNCGKVR